MPVAIPDRPYQVLAPDGQVVGDLPDVPPARLKEFFRWMLFGRVFSDKMVALQRQGRMGTFAPLTGQEAAQVAMGFAMAPQDWFCGSYRDMLPALIKGVPLLSMLRWWRGNVAEFPREARVLPLQVVIANQMLHAAGMAMAARIRGDRVVAVGACGDGATSEGDFHEALNFAAVFRAPAVFVVQNNGWAISVPVHRQTAAPTIAQKAVAYGMPGVLVDGNDVLACYRVIREAVERARAGEGPTLVECRTYRMGPHTTADDPRRYVPPAELEAWRQRDPLVRFRRFLQDRGLLTPEEEAAMAEAITAQLNAEVERLEALPPMAPDQVFDLVYAEPTPQLRAQKAAWRGEG